MNAKTRRRFHLAVLAAWVGPGAALSWVYAHSLAWIVFMSWFACVYSAASAYSAETPVEQEGESDELTEQDWQELARWWCEQATLAMKAREGLGLEITDLKRRLGEPV